MVRLKRNIWRLSGFNQYETQACHLRRRVAGSAGVLCASANYGFVPRRNLATAGQLS